MMNVNKSIPGNMGIVRNALKGKTFSVIDWIVWIMVSVYPLFVLPTLGFAIPRYIMLALLSLFALFLLARVKLRVNHPSFVALIFFVGFTLVATFFAKDPSVAWVGNYYRMTGFSTLAFSIILFMSVYHNPSTEKTLTFMIICAALVAIIAVFQHFGLNVVPEGYSTTPYSTIGNSNWLGTYLVFILPASILLFLQTNRSLFLVSSVLIYSGLLVCVTRGTWLAFIVAFAIITYYTFVSGEKAKKKRFAFLTITMILTTLILLPTNNAIILKRFLSIPDQMVSAVQLEKSAGSDRMYIWKETIEVIKENWAFGIGPDHLYITMPSGSIMNKAHNIYLEIAATTGIFALVSYLIFLSFFLRLRYCRGELGFLFFIMIFTYLLQGLFNNDVIMVIPLFWIVLGLSLANMKRIDTKTQTEVRSTTTVL